MHLLSDCFTCTPIPFMYRPYPYPRRADTISDLVCFRMMLRIKAQQCLLQEQHIFSQNYNPFPNVLHCSFYDTKGRRIFFIKMQIGFIKQINIYFICLSIYPYPQKISASFSFLYLIRGYQYTVFIKIHIIFIKVV